LSKISIHKHLTNLPFVEEAFRSV